MLFNENQKKLYLSATNLLLDDHVLLLMKHYPQVHFMPSARRGLAAACLKYDPVKGYPFSRYAKFWIHFFVNRHLEKEVPETKRFKQYGCRKPWHSKQENF